jgi:sec-independent protein translocase protein TatA
MGPIGAQEMFLIFIVALVLFGPKKLPELGRTVGKFLTQFRRVSSDLKMSFEREMQNLERETEAEKLREIGTTTIQQIQAKAAETFEYPYYDSGSFEPDPYDYTAAINPQVSASEVAGAEESRDESHEKLLEAGPETPSAEAVTGAAEADPAAVEGTVPRETPQHTN